MLTDQLLAVALLRASTRARSACRRRVAAAALSQADRARAELHRFEGDHVKVCAATCDAAVALLLLLVRGQDIVGGKRG